MPAGEKADIQVIGAGAGRTGTASLKAALEILGFGPCYHMYVCLKNKDFDKWSRAFTRKFSAEDWDDLLGGFKSAVDNPSSMAYQELMEAFPDAKVILTERDPKPWAQSVLDTIWCPYSRSQSWVLLPWFFKFQWMFKHVRRRFFGEPSGGAKGGAIRSPEKLAEAFIKWNEKVKETVPKEKLLIFSPKDGWEPLCKFLGKPVPDVPFPKVNEAGEFKSDMMRRWRKYLAVDVAIASAFAGLVAVSSVAIGKSIHSKVIKGK